jgi:hypothetical protein
LNNGKEDESVHDDELRKGRFSETERQEQHLLLLRFEFDDKEESSSKLFLPRIIIESCRSKSSHRAPEEENSERLRQSSVLPLESLANSKEEKKTKERRTWRTRGFTIDDAHWGLRDARRRGGGV